MKNKNDKIYSRREFCKLTGASFFAAGMMGFPHISQASQSHSKRRTIVIGADGMDPNLLRSYMNAGFMPNSKRLMQAGCFHRLATTYPPQSPVAWSSFISGMDPGGHGIYDFIARDAETITPHLSTTETRASAKSLKLGKFNIPLSGTNVELLRKGPTLWNILQENGVPSTAFKAPVNYPPTPSKANTISGITTPDIHGSYGLFTFYTNNLRVQTQDVSGGHIERIRLNDGVASCRLPGPVNSFRRDGGSVDIDFQTELDASSKTVRVSIQNHTLILREGEWSNWVDVTFPMMKWIAEVSGICRFYLKKTAPHLELYVSPININPANPSSPISTPSDYARELVDEVGYFYTQGMPEDTSALSARIWDDDDFKQQASMIMDERMNFYDYELNRFNQGFLFFYFSSLDLNSHAFWRTIDPLHPLYTKELAAKHGTFLRELYQKIDRAVGKALEFNNEHTDIYLISDHGFVSFRRQFHLNSWLMDHGYAKAKNRFDRGNTQYFMDLDWNRTKAYGLGINSLYLNIKGREPEGTVQPGDDADRLRDELIQRLTAVTDPQSGEQVITKVLKPEQIYSGPYVETAPDLIVCYNQNYRASWDTILGSYPREHIVDNLDPWSGDHCMDAQFLSGVLVSNRKLQRENPRIMDMAPTILSRHGIPEKNGMKGSALL